MSIKGKFYSSLKTDREKFLKYSAVKICFMYLILGFNWIYFSDRIANKLSNKKSIVLIINIYKGWIYVLVTSIILYLLINIFLNKVCLTEKKLDDSYKKLEQVNEELQAYVQQLAASEEELKIHYDKTMKINERLSRSEEKNKSIIKAIPDLIFILDNRGFFIDCNTNDENRLLVPKENFIGKNLWDVLPEEVADIAWKKMKMLFKNGELQNFKYKWNYNNKGIDEYYEVRMVKNSEKEVLCMVRDITEEKYMELKLEYLSYHDQLTGLYNRRFFNLELERLDTEANLPLTIVMADVNGLKLINDSFGHVMGDELLKKVSGSIIEGSRKNDIIARLGGDEFIILLPRTDIIKAEQIIKNIKNIASKQKIKSINISISFGYEVKKKKGQNIKEILKKAEGYMYKKKLFESPSVREKTIKAIISTLHEKNKREEQHSFRTAELCRKMGKALSLPESEIEDLKTAGLLHDIGKIAIEENILNKKERLTSNEREEMKRHPEIGYRILSTVNDMLEISQYVLAHHERWDGCGYPKGLRREKIPLQSRIISIADAYDAMISKRSYSDVMPEEIAVQKLREDAGTQFDPALVNIFIQEVLKK